MTTEDDDVIFSPPKYQQVSDYIYKKIQQNIYPIDTKIESEETYARLFHISRGTVRQAIKDLEKDGLIETTHGKGSFVIRKTKSTPIRFVSFLIPDDYGFDIFNNSFYMPILVSLERYGKQNNLKIAFSTYSNEEFEKNPKAFFDHIGDGCFLTRSISVGMEALLYKNKTPCVMIGSTSPNDVFCSVMADNIHGAYLATKYLITLGHRRIAHITHDMRRITGQQRYKGYRQALEEYNISFEKALVIECNSKDPLSIRSALDSFIGNTNFTAIFAGSDSRSIIAIDNLRERGYRIPQDISIVGFDNTFLSNQPVYSLTTVDINKELMAEKAMEFLLAQISGEEIATKAITIPVSLIIRGSCRDV